MGSARAVPVVLVVVTVAVLAPVAPLAGADAVGAGGQVPARLTGGGAPPAQAVGADAPRTDNTVTRIAVRADGDARWRVRIRTRLSTDSQVEQYRTFQAGFRNDTGSYLGPFADRIRGVVAESANATGREMRARNFSASTSIQELPRRWGVVTYSFTWTEFARTDGDALVVGDVFQGGLLLTANDSLVVQAPSGYTVAEVAPEPTDQEADAVTWEGERSFGDHRPRVRLVPAATPTPTPTPTPGDEGADVPWLALVGALVGLVAVGALLGILRRGGRPGGDASRGDTANGDAAGDGATTSGTSGGDATDGSPVLTDGERVERLLADAGGRMKQADVADELGWSASKTSRVVSDLVEADRVEKLRVGRENVLDLAEDGD
jgi:hypothetical protein